MALTAGNKPLASDFINLKARVKTEMNRRNRTNSLASYAGTSYDYTTAPAAGGKLLAEHIEKIIVPINAIKSTGFAAQQDGLTIKALNTVDAQLSAHSNYPIRGSGTDCTSGCSGLCSGCSGTCSGGCSGCGGACSNSCSGGCDGGCSGSCSGGCSGNCGSSCGGCTGCSGCGDACSSCGDLCTGGCGRLAG